MTVAAFFERIERTQAGGAKDLIGYQDTITLTIERAGPIAAFRHPRQLALLLDVRGLSVGKHRLTLEYFGPDGESLGEKQAGVVPVESGKSVTGILGESVIAFPADPKSGLYVLRVEWDGALLVEIPTKLVIEHGRSH